MGTSESGILFIVATPIGNLEDVSLRAIRVLGEVDVLACEDTRHTRRLLDRHGIISPKALLSYHEHNESRAGKRIMDLLRRGRSVAVCSDSGIPGISDPGYRLVSACRERGIRVEVLPGASAVATALVASGLPTSSYTFKGFAPRKPGPRKRFLETDRQLPHTLVFFESPYRLGKFLQDALDVLGNRVAAVCIELTKKFESVQRGYLEELVARFCDERVHGEVTVVIAGNHPKFRGKPAVPDT